MPFRIFSSTINRSGTLLAVSGALNSAVYELREGTEIYRSSHTISFCAEWGFAAQTAQGVELRDPAGQLLTLLSDPRSAKDASYLFSGRSFVAVEHNERVVRLADHWSRSRQPFRGAHLYDRYRERLLVDDKLEAYFVTLFDDGFVSGGYNSLVAATYDGEVRWSLSLEEGQALGLENRTSGGLAVRDEVLYLVTNKQLSALR